MLAILTAILASSLSSTGFQPVTNNPARPPLQVGNGKTFSRIEDAVQAAKEGDAIEVYPSSNGYSKTAVRVTKNGLNIKGIGQIRIDGDGFSYSGVGSVPRAIFQIDADDVSLDNFDLAGAHNDSYNGAGVRINAGKRATVRNCRIHDNDMGIMSNGRENDPHSAENQLIEKCEIYKNGNQKDPGYNHNLYLGGTSVTLRFCQIYGALTGHNLKSRAHYIQVEYCYIHDSANRECDFVEAWDTSRPDSNAVLIGNVIVKDPNCTGNRMVIHFGQEKGKRLGKIFLINNTIVTPFASPVLGISGDGTSGLLTNNVIVNTEQAEPRLAQRVDWDTSAAVTGAGNWLSALFNKAGHAIGMEQNTAGKSRKDTPFLQGTSEFVLGEGAARLHSAPASFVDGSGVLHRVTLEWKYVGRGKWERSKGEFVGAG